MLWAPLPMGSQGPLDLGDQAPPFSDDCFLDMLIVFGRRGDTKGSHTRVKSVLEFGGRAAVFS